MKTESTVRPEKFTIENLNKYEKCLVRFNTNITEEERQIEETEETQTFYIYDSYAIRVWFRDNLKADIEENFDTWLNFARDKEIEELSAEVREKRNKLLDETDKDMVLDRLKLNMPEEISLTNIVQAMKDFFTSLKEIFNSDLAKYRQALRDVPQQEGFPYDVKFPEKPTNKEE